MPAPATVDEFIDLIRKSGVVDESRLSAYVKQLQSNSDIPSEMSKFAGLFVRDGLLTFFQAEQFLLGKWKRFTIGKYKVLERLGSGGMGQVFLCEHKLMRRKVAVKVLPTAKAEDPSSLERFYREARAVAALDHPNIVRAYDIDQDDNLHFLVMEYVDGASLQEIIKKFGHMDVTRACHYMYWSAIGLEHAHQAGLIHRDIKPGNILIDRQGIVKILDMGLARFFNDDEDLLTKKYDENVLGTADYLAPEQALDSHGVDGRADIYSLGATFYFLLTGTQPFVEGTVAQKLIWHQTRNPRSIRELRPEVPEGVVAVVEKMMAKDRAQRYQTPRELAEALEPWVQTSIEAPPEREMPTLSAAAQAIGGSSTAVPIRPTPPAPRTSTGSSARQETNSAPPASKPRNDGSAKRRARNPVPASTTAETADTARHPTPIVESLPPDSEPADWESLAADTHDAVRDRTDRQPNSTKPKSTRAAKTEPVAQPKRSSRRLAPKRSRMPLLIAGLAIAALAAGFAVYWFVFRTPAKTNAPQSNATNSGRLTVSRPGGGGQFNLVRDALANAGDGARIVILDSPWEESLLTATGQGKGVTIEGAEGKDIVWRVSPRNPAQRLILLQNPEGLKIRNLRFEGDPNENVIAEAISVTGNVTGFGVEDVTITNFNDAAIRFNDCQAADSSPAIVQRVRIIGNSKKAPASGIAFSAPVRQGVKPNQNITIRDCRFENLGTGCAFAFEFSTNRIELQNNRIWNAADGIFFKDAKKEYAYRVHVANNTFHTITNAAIHFKNAGFLALPASAPHQLIELDSNYFANVNFITRSDDNFAAFPFKLQHNVRDNATKEGTPSINAAVIDFSLPLDPNDDKHFLRYPKTSPLFTAAAGKPVGAPPAD
jgi:serine/threonine protein kinase